MTLAAPEQYHAAIGQLLAEHLPNAAAELLSITYSLRGRMLTAAMVARGLDVPIFAYLPASLATPQAIVAALVLDYWTAVDREAYVTVWGDAEGFDAEQAAEILRGGARLDA